MLDLGMGMGNSKATSIPQAFRARAFRLLVNNTAAMTGTRIIIAEIEMLDMNNVNIATELATVDNGDAIAPASRAFNGLVGIQAGQYAEIPKADGTFIGQDFTDQTAIKTIRVTSASATYPLPSFIVQYSDDLVNWTALGEMQSLNVANQWVEFAVN